MTYSQKLKDPRWQKKRLEALQRSEFRCCTCGANDKTLHVHHLKYLPKKEPWDVPLNYLKALCEECHLEEELDKQKFKNLVDFLLIQYDLPYMALIDQLLKLKNL